MEDEDLHAAVFEVIRRIGPPAITVLVDLLGDEDVVNRRNAVDTLRAAHRRHSAGVETGLDRSGRRGRGRCCARARRVGQPGQPLCRRARQDAAVDNGNAASLEPFQASQRRAFSGLALLVVRTKRGEKGPIRVTATADGLVPADVTLTSE